MIIGENFKFVGIKWKITNFKTQFHKCSSKLRKSTCQILFRSSCFQTIINWALTSGDLAVTLTIDINY